MIFNEYNITIYTSMVNENKDLKPQAVLDIFQYGAVRSSEEYHIDGPSIIDQGVIWVLVSVHYETLKFGTGQGEYILKTWPRKSYSKIKHLREYVLVDENNDVVIKGTSLWCLIDINTKMPCYRPNIGFPANELLEDKVFEHEPPTITTQLIKNAAEPQYFPILKSYYDSNKHTNNANYGMFIFEAMNKEDTIKTFTLDFISQSFFGDIICVFSIKNTAEPQYFSEYVGEKLIFKALVEVKKWN